MRFSICIAAHNEAHLLSRTFHAVRTSLLATSLSSPAFPGDTNSERANPGDALCEIIVVDDASTDGSIAAALANFPNSAELPLRVERFETRQGASPAKHRAAELARGGVLVFLDAHVLPEPGALERLVAGVEASQGRDLLTPALPALDESTFTVIPGRTGLGYGLDLADLSCRWLPLSNLQLDEETRLYHQPALIGCVLAVSRETYFALGGFDTGMKVWGVEDIDFGLKAWSLGYGLKLDVLSRVAHRFQRAFDHYEVPAPHVLHNKLRLAAKHFSPHHLQRWLARNTPSHSNSFLLPRPTCRENPFLLPRPVCRERAGVRVYSSLHPHPPITSLPSGVLPSISSTSTSPVSRQSVRWFKAAACGMNSTMPTPSSLTGPATNQIHPNSWPWP